MLLSDYDWKEIELLEHLRSMLPHKVLQLSRENCRRFIERFSEMHLVIDVTLLS